MTSQYSTLLQQIWRMHSWDRCTGAAPPKAQLAEHCAEVVVYISNSTGTIDHNENKNTKTRQDVFLGQIRHTSSQIGFPHSVFLGRTGLMMDTIGPKI
jgi:hypothetical protein